LRHRHTGPVHVFTLAGRWNYLEYDDVNTAGSFLYEPAGSVHTFNVPQDNVGLTDIWFTIVGANLNLDEDDNVISIDDAASVLLFYLRAVERAGLPHPPVVTI
jgi:hypothetical protein